MGGELTEKFREQSKRFGTEIFTETVNSVDLYKRPFVIRSDGKEVEAQTVIIATGALARRMVFPGSGEGKAGYWNKVPVSLPPHHTIATAQHLIQHNTDCLANMSTCNMSRERYQQDAREPCRASQHARCAMARHQPSATGRWP